MAIKPWTVMGTCLLGWAAVACSSDSDATTTPEKSELGAPNPDGEAGDAETPPTTNGADVEAWLKKKHYESWTCETVEHPQMGVSPHGTNRVCVNAVAAAYSASEGERPAGSAAVKELYDDDAKLVGYAVSVKTKAKSADGGNWYWYERVPLDSAAPHDDAGVVADGLGSAGAAKSICVGCHAAAGADKTHSVMGSTDFIYLQPQAPMLDPEGDAQTPPTGDADALEAWLARGDYDQWACETVEHPQMGVSPHGINRVCSNDLVAEYEGGPGDERPIGSASVKELYDDDAELVGFAVAVKVGAKSSGGSQWYWYERTTAGVFADGLGNSGAAKTSCVGCHAAAGADETHHVTGSSDYVYLQAMP